LVDPAIVVVMFAVGMQLGFVGLGGAGVVAALLIAAFNVPVHLSFATALGAMFASSCTGGWSHLREGNVEPVIAIQVGLVGMVGAYLGGGLALATGATQLKTMAGLALTLNSFVLYFRTRVPARAALDTGKLSVMERWWKELPGSAFIGILCGLFTGFLS
jgi:uncharacterized membrane protein YfcA